MWGRVGFWGAVGLGWAVVCFLVWVLGGGFWYVVGFCWIWLWYVVGSDWDGIFCRVGLWCVMLCNRRCRCHCGVMSEHELFNLIPSGSEGGDKYYVSVMLMLW